MSDTAVEQSSVPKTKRRRRSRTVALRRWFAVVDGVTDEDGLVTSEMVPAFRATGPDLERGGLRLAQARP